MNNDPQVAPNDSETGGLNQIQTRTETPENAVQRRVRFTFKGRKYRIFRRTDDGPFYFHFQYEGQRHKRSLETTDTDEAIVRAREMIQLVKRGQWTRMAPESARVPSITLGKVLGIYPHITLIAPHSARNNMLAIRQICRTVFHTEDPDSTPLFEINKLLAVRFQRAMVERYLIESRGQGEGAAREARERALRSSRSLIQQARGVFRGKGNNLSAEYEAAGIVFPPSVQDFVRCPLEGKISQTEHNRPPDSVIEKAFEQIGPMRESDPHVFLGFWFAVGAGLRRAEIQRLQWDHVIVRNGATWISGGIGKDHCKIEVPMQSRAAESVEPLRKTEGLVMGTERSLEWAKRLNFWMKSLGWNTEKKMHELRAYIGSKIYDKNPVAAMRFLRHKSIKITESFYCRYTENAAPVDVL